MSVVIISRNEGFAIHGQVAEGVIIGEIDHPRHDGVMLVKVTKILNPAFKDYIKGDEITVNIDYLETIG
jgi:hypothetical protein